MLAFLNLWVEVVVELAHFAMSYCSKLDPSSFGVHGFLCEFVIPGTPSAFLDFGGSEKVKIIFRDAKIALKVFTGLKSIPEAFGEGWITVEGPIEYGVVVTKFFFF